MLVLIVYNAPVLPPGHPHADSDHEIVDTAGVVCQYLTDAGIEARQLALGRDPAQLIAAVRVDRPDVIFNLFEGLADQYDTESHVAGLLDWLGIPYTGSPYQTLCLARSKPLTKYLLRGADLPTPDFHVVDSLPLRSSPARWPVIVKPAEQDASVGLDQGSVVSDEDQLTERVGFLLDQFDGPVLVEQYIPGREFNIAVIEYPELRVLPPSEIEFVGTDPNSWPIVTYDAKWKPGSPDYEATPARYPAVVSSRLADRLGRLACRAFRLLGCRDYARVDFRVRPTGQAYILEVNPNPDFSPTAGLSGGLTSAGLTHAQFTVDLVHAALNRGSNGKTTLRRKAHALKS
jgi:D-alanine-D-alanine ligase